MRPLMQDIGAAKRRIHIEERRDQLTTYLGTDTDVFPHPLVHYSTYKERLGKIPLLPGFVSIVAVDDTADLADFQQNPNALDFYLPPLKPRAIDPLYIDEAGEIKRLSQTDSHFALLVEQQKQLLAQAYVGRIHVNNETRVAILHEITENQAEWETALQRPRMPEAVMRSMLHNSVGVAAMSRMIDIWLD